MAKKPIPKKPSPTQAVSVTPVPSTKAVKAELPFPIIKHAANNSLLYPLDARQGTTAKLTLPAGSTRVIVHFAIKGQSCATFPPISVASGDVADIPWQWISTCIGRTVLIWYEAVVGGARKESLVLELEIQDVREEHLRESMPEFAHAELEWGTSWLSMFKFTRNETIRVKAWPMIRAGSRLFVIVAGNEQNVPPLFMRVAFDHVVTEEEAHEGFVFEFELPRPWLARLDDYSSCTCHSGVIWEGCHPQAPVSSVNPLPGNAQDFHQRSTVLLRVDPALALNPPRLQEAVQISPGNWQVNPANTTQGGHALVTYPGMTEGDHVCMQASGPNYGPVSLGCQDVKQGDVSLSFDVSPEIFAALFCQQLTLIYSVQFNNHLPQNSPERVIQVLGPQLTKLCIEQATGHTLDLKTFSDDATVLVPIWDYAAVGQCVWVWISGTLEDGSPYQFFILMDEPLTAGWITNGVDAPIPRSELQKLEDCSDFKLHAAVSFDGQCDLATALKFPVQTFSIDQEDFALNAPEVREAVGNQLTIYNGRNGITVRVAYPHMSSRHQILLNCKRSDGTDVPLPPKPGNSNPGYVDFSVAREEVIHAAGETLTFNYTVSSACKLQTSGDLNLKISVPVRLTALKVEQATLDVLDLRTFPGDAKITLEPWWFILIGQIFWLEVIGAAEADGAPLTIKIAVAEPLIQSDVTNGLQKLISRLDLEKFRNNSVLTVAFKVTTKVGGTLEKAIEFQKLNLAFKKKYRDLTVFDSQTLEPWKAGAGAGDPRDLSNEQITGPDGKLRYAIKNFTYGNNSAGPILQRAFNDLESGHTYRFSVKVRQYGYNPPAPKLSLSMDGIRQTPILTLSDLAWHTLEFAFVASTDSAFFVIYSHEASGAGNDWYMIDFLVEEV
nr:carbohydrate binding domain-containing protein [uncultured Pseudomonas sp.]